MNKIDRRGFLTGAAALSLIGWRRLAIAAGYPEYYAEHFRQVTERINALSKTCTDGFWFITDLHIKSNRRKSGMLIAELSKLTGMNRVLCGGDLVEAFGAAYPTDKAAVDFAIDAYAENWVRPLRAAGCKLYTAKGNHDFTVCHSYNTPADKKRGFTYDGKKARQVVIEASTERDIVSNPTDPTACYYYFDNAAAKLRYVVADTTDTESAGDVPWGVHYGMHETQLKWLDEVALATTPKDYGIVVMHHIPVTGVVGSDKDEELFAPFRQILEKYRGRVIMDITGHHHCEMETFQRGILHVTEPCDAAYQDYILRSKPWCGELPKKTEGTIAEQTFDAVQIDRERGLVHFTRVGGGQNRTFHLEPRAVKPGETLKLAAPRLSGKVTWGCYDADRVDNVAVPNRKYVRRAVYHNRLATISVTGELTTLAPGEIMVIAMDEKLNKEIFPIRVEV